MRITGLEGQKYPPFGADHKASMTSAALMQNKVICAPAGRAAGARSCCKPFVLIGWAASTWGGWLLGSLLLAGQGLRARPQ